jgi:hypothetical protein
MDLYHMYSIVGYKYVGVNLWEECPGYELLLSAGSSSAIFVSIWCSSDFF